MEMPNQFRSAFNGFNREDVVRYMEYVNNKHSAQIVQLTNELDFLRSKQEVADNGRMLELEAQVKSLRSENDVLHNRIEELEMQLRAAREALGNAQPAAAAAPTPSDEELEAYRRAERAERIAKERALQIGNQTAEVLADATAKVDVAAELIARITREVADQLNLAQVAVKSSRQAFQDASDSIEQLRSDMQS